MFYGHTTYIHTQITYAPLCVCICMCICLRLLYCLSLVLSASVSRYSSSLALRPPYTFFFMKKISCHLGILTWPGVVNSCLTVSFKEAPAPTATTPRSLALALSLSLSLSRVLSLSIFLSVSLARSRALSLSLALTCSRCCSSSRFVISLYIRMNV